MTSGHRALAQRRLAAVGLPVPAAMVCGDEVARGKPDPEGFLAGARLLGVAPESCVALEDAPAGLRAARAAGMRVIGITTTHEAAALSDADVRDRRPARARRRPRTLARRPRRATPVD